MAPERSSRPYDSPLREQQAERTRSLILDALTELLRDHPADEVTTRQVAERAGVSQPTVYRHFPDRSALIDGLAERIEAQARDRAGSPTTLEGWAAWAVAAFRAADEHDVEVTADAVLNADPRRVSQASRDRTAALEASIRASHPELDVASRKRLAALVRVLLSSQAWLRMREEFGLTGAESGPAVRWAVEVLAREASSMPKARHRR